jgi:hypothetical protein
MISFLQPRSTDWWPVAQPSWRAFCPPLCAVARESSGHPKDRWGTPSSASRPLSARPGWADAGDASCALPACTRHTGRSGHQIRPIKQEPLARSQQEDWGAPAADAPAGGDGTADGGYYHARRERPPTPLEFSTLPTGQASPAPVMAPRLTVRMSGRELLPPSRRPPR